MTSSEIEPSNIDVVIPQWSIQPQSHEHAPLRKPPFETLWLPEITNPVLGIENVFFNTSGRLRSKDNPNLERQIKSIIETRRRETETFNEKLYAKLESQGLYKEEIMPRLRKFFNGRLARLHPADILYNDPALCFRLGRTKYFTYAGARTRKDLKTYSLDRLGLPLAVCSLVTVPSEDGNKKLLYTIRGTANETYPGWFHTAGGTVQTIQNGIADPNRAIVKEIMEETGLEQDEFTVQGIIGVIMNNFDIHPEIIYLTHAHIPLEQWLGKRETDREVDLHVFTDTPENLEAIITGQRTNELTDSRPLVPPGLCSYLFYGRMRYGQEWYEEVSGKIPQY